MGGGWQPASRRRCAFADQPLTGVDINNTSINEYNAELFYGANARYATDPHISLIGKSWTQRDLGAIFHTS